MTVGLTMGGMGLAPGVEIVGAAGVDGTVLVAGEGARVDDP